MTVPDGAFRQRSMTAWVGLAFVLGIFLVAGLLRLNDLSLYSPDSIRYVIWGNSLASGKGFTDDTQPDAQRFVEHAPFYSVLIAPVEFFFPRSLTAVKVATLLWGVLALLLFFLWLKRRVGETAALAGTLLLACNPLLLVYSTEALSEAPFLAFLCGMLLLADSVVDDPSPRRSSWFLLLALTATIGLLREIGVAAVAAVSLYFLVRRRFLRAALLFLAAALCIGLWYYRNQILVGLPPGSAQSNSALVFEHFVTPPGAHLVSELVARSWLSLQSYAWQLCGMILFPLHGSGQVNLALTPAELSPTLRLLVVAVVLLLVGAGIAAEKKEGAGALFRATLCAGYLLIVLLYPVHDIRFLFPILPLMIYFLLRGARTIAGRIPALLPFGRVSVIVPLLLVLLLPNILLMGEIVGTNMSYRSSPVTFYRAIIARPTYPTVYTYPYGLVGAWIRDSVPAHAIIASPAKQIAILVGDRKVLEANPGLTLPLFERMIRDNNVSYLLSETRWENFRVYEFLMGESERFRFDSVFAAGNLRLYKITSLLEHPDPAWRRAVPQADSASASGLMRLGRARFLAGDYHAAEEDFLRASNLAPREADPVYESVITCAMAEDSLGARRAYARLMALPQSASFLYTARVHLQAMDVALSAKGVPPTQERAIKMNDLGRLFWELGYRKRAEEVCDDALRLDSTYFWGLLWGFHFNLQNGDTVDARRYLRQLTAIDGTNQIVHTFGRILAIGDSLGWVRDRAVRSALHLSAAQLYRQIELYDVALDEAERAIGEAPGGTEAPRLRRMIAAAWSHADSIRNGDIPLDRVARVDSLR